MSPPPAIVVRPHPPERLIRALARGEVAACCGCGACCCCCLHSLGSLVGAIAGSNYPDDPPGPGAKGVPPAGLRDDELDGPVAVAPARPVPVPRPVAAAVFWWSTAALAAMVIVVQPPIWVDTGPAMRIGLLIFALPAVLLGGAVVSALVIAGVSPLRKDIREWKRLGWITLGLLAGALIGVVLMLSLFRR